jgi:uncharacterized sulfatase
MRLTLLAAVFIFSPAVHAEDRPNILWITCEDITPNLGCYGDTYAVTPNLDRLATQSVRYTRAFAPIGVCAPSRSSLILGMYAPSVGTQHMRCQGVLPTGVKCFPQYLCEAGYYCTNNAKTDYNFTHDRATWDENSNRAHWRKRKVGQPFFSVFNILVSHESKIRQTEQEYQQVTANFTAQERHDPAKAPIPPYHPDTPEVRRDWARYADMITAMDQRVGEFLKQLDDDGLANDTIVFFFSDHGAGMPRSKRWLYDSSTRVPFMVRVPEKWKQLASAAPGTTTDRLISFVDCGPTVLSLAGVNVPTHMQGVPFLGPAQGPPREFVFGFRDRMDERTDLLRSVHDKRFNYIRNYHPERPWFHEQHISYMYQMPTMQAWQRLADAGKLTGPAAIFMRKFKPIEELYDVEVDPHEINNLAYRPEYKATRDRMHAALRRWQVEIIDLGFLPEAELRSRFGMESPYDAVRSDPSRYPLERLREAADDANELQIGRAVKLTSLVNDVDPAVRYWGVVGQAWPGERVRPQAPRSPFIASLKAKLTDGAAIVRVAAADGLCMLGQRDAARPVLLEAMADANEWIRLQAADALDRADDRDESVRAAMQKAVKDSNQYVVRIAQHYLGLPTD